MPPVHHVIKNPCLNHLPKKILCTLGRNNRSRYL